MGRAAARGVNFAAAATYAQRHALQAMLVQRDGETLYASYADGFDAATPHALYSGTKSFWGVAAVAAESDGLLRLDEAVGATFPAWQAGRRAGVTLRHLLTLTSGIGFGGLGNAVPTYEKALAVDVRDEPGSRFTYGGIPLQIFGAVLARKLGAGRTPHAYLRERVLEPLGVRVAAWRTLADGTHPLPTGAFLSAADWATFGRFVIAGGARGAMGIVDAAALARCFTGTTANPRYGLTWWLNPLRGAATDLVYASGAGGQALYLSAAERTVIVKFGKSGAYSHAAFLRKLLA